MNRLIFLFFFITHLVTAQIQEGQVYKIGDRFDSASCGTHTSFPRISRLVFFSKKTFLMYYGQKGIVTKETPSIMQVGFYSVVGDSIKLTCTKAGYDLASDYSKRGMIGLGRSVLLRPFSMAIRECNGNLVLIIGLKELNFGSRETRVEESEMRSIKEDKYYTKIYEELKRMEE